MGKFRSKKNTEETAEQEKTTGKTNTAEKKQQDKEEQRETNPSDKKQDEVSELEGQLQEEKEKYLRLYSEFENFRRRSAKEKLEVIKTASADLARELLSILDDFDRAKKANEHIEDAQTLKEGFDLIQDKFQKILASKGIKEMEATGEPFDVDKHEALTQIPVDDDQKGKVIEVIEKGYYINDAVLRYAKVVVGQ